MSILALSFTIGTFIVLAVCGWLMFEHDILLDGIGTVALIVGSLAAIGFLLSGICLMVDHAQRGQCARTQQTTGIRTRYVDLNTGCFVLVDGQWTPYDRWVNVSGGAR